MRSKPGGRMVVAVPICSRRGFGYLCQSAGHYHPRPRCLLHLDVATRSRSVHHSNVQVVATRQTKFYERIKIDISFREIPLTQCLHGWPLTLWRPDVPSDGHRFRIRSSTTGNSSSPKGIDDTGRASCDTVHKTGDVGGVQTPRPWHRSCVDRRRDSLVYVLLTCRVCDLISREIMVGPFPIRMSELTTKASYR